MGLDKQFLKISDDNNGGAGKDKKQDKGENGNLEGVELSPDLLSGLEGPTGAAGSAAVQQHEILGGKKSGSDDHVERGRGNEKLSLVAEAGYTKTEIGIATFKDLNFKLEDFITKIDDPQFNHLSTAKEALDFLKKVKASEMYKSAKAREASGKEDGDASALLKNADKLYEALKDYKQTRKKAA